MSKSKQTIRLVVLTLLSLCLLAALVGCNILTPGTGSTPAASNNGAQSIALSAETLEVAVGGFVRVTATVEPAEADQTVSWSSANPAVAIVSEGVVVGVTDGTTTITATTANGKSATCTVTVGPVAESVTLNKTAITLGVNKSATITATVLPADAMNKTVTFTSSKPTVATVDANGKVVGVSTGTATITVKTANGKSATCTVTVQPGDKVILDSSYKIVHANKTAITTSANTLKTAIYTATGLSLTAETPAKGAAVATEIVIGDMVFLSNGAREGVKNASAYDYDAWEIYVTAERIFINGGSDEAVGAAVSYFIQNYVTNKTTVSMQKTESKTGTVAPTEVTLSDASKLMLSGGAKATTSGVTLTAKNDTVGFKVNAGGTISLTFGGSSADKFRVYVDKKSDYIEVTGGEIKTILSDVARGTYEVLVVKTEGTTASTLACVSAVGATLTTPPTAKTTKTSYDIYNNYYSYMRTLGRTMKNGYGIVMDYSASGVEFNVYITSTTDLVGKLVSASSDSYFTVYVDGVKRSSHVKFDKGTGDTTVTTEAVLISGLEPGVHTIRVVSDSHVRHGYRAMAYFEFAGDFLAKPAEASKLIEFIGDSITCGYGVLATTSTSNSGTAEYADATQAYAYLTAEKLKADYSILGYSGQGLYVSEDSTKNVPEFYLYAGNTGRGAGAKWNFDTNRHPDLIVVNLGTNDDIKCDNNTDDTDGKVGYQAKAQAFIRYLRAKHPNVPIIWAYGSMEDTLKPSIQAALEAEGGTANKLYYCQLTKNREGGSTHPNAVGQAQAAADLTAFIKANIAGFAD